MAVGCIVCARVGLCIVMVVLVGCFLVGWCDGGRVSCTGSSGVVYRGGG
jgi:hypothetical protein